MRPLVIQEPTLDLASEPKQTLAQKKHLKQKYVLLDINSVCESGLSIYFCLNPIFVCEN